ncbi:DNA-binding protein RFX7-like [Synchiropus splendidus]|uniref:DNA-binding protein RFX7-like n=1 Tax=Synchiropus splendidus TaxID=270530 RepID=UPI00237D7AC4|nr:DNA-binding protein RFX7-like [Synchiropus splendidus]
MDEEDPQQLQTERGAGSTPGLLLPGLQGAEAGALQLRIKNSICKSVQTKVDNIVQDVEKFSDIEKLYLYLKLPSGPSGNTDKSDQSALTSSRTQQTYAFNWIHNHLEEYPETSLPKQEVYDEYKSFCDNLNYHPLSAADFGKMMKNVFPNMKARRLGMRGKSKYCYSGLRKRPFVHIPSLPNLDLHQTGDGLQCDVLESPNQLSSIKEEVRFAACDLVCEWAQKVLKRHFDAVEDLARFLIDSHYISNKSMAALTIVTGTATDAQQSVSAFIPTSEAHTFLPQVTTLSSPSIDAKQQLQRKIQRKQQEQKLHSPLPGDGLKKTDDNTLSESPITPSPQPAIGIVVAAIPSPNTAQRSRLVSSSPMVPTESKVMPVNFQMVTQPVQPLKQSPKPPPNNASSSMMERTARQRYAQILPKPVATTAITLRSPSTMIIASSPITTVMTSCHVTPVSLVKMTAISLASNSSNTSTSLSNSTLRPASAGITMSAPVEDLDSGKNSRSASAVASLAPEEPLQDPNLDVEMEAILKNSQEQSHLSMIEGQGVLASRAAGTLQRAASVPIPQIRGCSIVEEMPQSIYEGKVLSSTQSVVETGDSNNTSTLPFTPSCEKTNAVLSFNTNGKASFGENSIGLKSVRKRSGLSPILSPVKRVFMPQQSLGGTAGLGCGLRNTISTSQHPFAPTRPESAPASREVEMKMNLSTQVHSMCTSSARASDLCTVAKTQSSMQRKNMSHVVETSTSVSQPFIQLQEHTTSNMPSMSNHSQGTSFQVANCGAENPGDVQPQTFVQSIPAANPVDYLNRVSGHNPMQAESYFSFDDDVTQDSIVEELVQMEEQMKLQKLRSSALHEGTQAVIPDNLNSFDANMATFYQPINSSRGSNIHTPTPTQTPTSELIGAAQGQTTESPCPRFSSVTPVDSALGSSRHTGTPQSNCSSTVAPSPVECRNQFAFTPINSNITGFHDGSTVSCSPVKPMQRPMATHPDKTRLEWMNNSYNNSTGTLNKSSNGLGILPSYQGLIDDHFQKPHAFAVPHARHNDGHFGRLTPISPVQQQVASMANVSRQEGFAVPAPLDGKSTSSGSFRCRSVSPAVHQRNLSGNPGSGAPQTVNPSCISPFNSPVTPEVLNIFSQGNLAATTMAQRSRSVPANVMMQTEESSLPGQHCSSQNIGNVLLSKLDGSHDDGMRGMGINNLPSSYTARMNLSQLLQSNQLHTMSSESSTAQRMQQSNYLIDTEQMILSAGESHVQSVTGGNQSASAMQVLRSQQQESQPQLDFTSTLKNLQPDNSQSSEGQIMEPDLGTDFPCELRMPSELSGNINDFNALDTHLLFDPSQSQGQYQNSSSEELANNALFQQITAEAEHQSGLDWLGSKDHPAVGLMG